MQMQTTYGPNALSLADVIALCERRVANEVFIEHEDDIALLVDLVISELIARDLLNEHRS